MITPEDKAQAEAAVWLTLPEAMERIAALEELSIRLFKAWRLGHDSLVGLSLDDALNADLEASAKGIEAEVTRILGRPPVPVKTGCE